jgi:hypothetical protein
MRQQQLHRLLLSLSVCWCLYTSSYATKPTKVVAVRSKILTTAFAIRPTLPLCRRPLRSVQHAFGALVVVRPYIVSPLLALKTVIEDPSNIDFLTPLQIRQLRHETQRRRARQALATVYWNDEMGNDDDDDNDNDNTTAKLQHIARLLCTEHLVQVRSLAPQQIALVKSTAERLARQVAMEMSNLEETAATTTTSTTSSSSSTAAVVAVTETMGRSSALSLEPDDSFTSTGNNSRVAYDVNVNSDDTMSQSSASSSARFHHHPAASSAVFVVEIVGHAAVLYRPPLPPSTNDGGGSGGSTTSTTTTTFSNKLTLRTTGKFNQWDKRRKAPRDNRGQIVR